MGGDRGSDVGAIALVRSASTRRAANTANFCLESHGIDAARRLFVLPTDEIARVAQPAPDRIRGYIGYGKAALAYSRGEATPPDIEASFNVDPLAPPVDGGDTDAGRIGAHFAANPWPELCE